MADIPETLKTQIEAAFDYRGHVTIALADGKKTEGFLFNREFGPDGFVEVFPKGQDGVLRYPITAIKSIALTGADSAAGNSYEDYLKKKQEKKS